MVMLTNSFMYGKYYYVASEIIDIYTIAIRANQRAYLVEKMIEENKEKVEASVT